MRTLKRMLLIGLFPLVANGTSIDFSSNESAALEELTLKHVQTQALNEDPIAQLRLGLFYLHGSQGLSVDPQRAVDYFKLAADQGNASAHYYLGEMVYQGLGTAKNQKKAFMLFEVAANQGIIPAHYKLAQLYLTGKGVEKNARAAFEHYLAAATQGHTASQMQLAFLYGKGKGVPKDLKQSVQWYQAAALGGNPRAQYKLGLALAKGKGISKNLPLAHAWLKLAAQKGSSLSDMYQRKLESKMKPEEMKLAQAHYLHYLNTQTTANG